MLGMNNYLYDDLSLIGFNYLQIVHLDSLANLYCDEEGQALFEVNSLDGLELSCLGKEDINQKVCSEVAPLTNNWKSAHSRDTR